MTEQDKNEIKEIISLTMTARNAEIMANQTIMDNKLDGINDHLKKLNGKVAKHEQKLVDFEIAEKTHVNNCPHNEAIKKLRENQISSKAIRNWIIAAIALLSTTLGIIWVSLNIISKINTPI